MLSHDRFLQKSGALLTDLSVNKDSSNWRVSKESLFFMIVIRTSSMIKSRWVETESFLRFFKFEVKKIQSAVFAVN